MPEISRAFLLNVKMFCIAEAFILVLALLLAIVRSLPGPVFFPMRALGIAYADFFRGVPTILVIALLGFGAPALQLSWVPLSTTFWGIVALVLVYTAYVSEVYRAGIESVHRSQDAAARSLGLTHWQSLSRVVLPQAVRRVIPPLLNDFIGLQKDTALVGFLGSVEAFKQSQIDAAATFNYTPFVAAAVLFVALTIPLARFTDWLVAPRPTPAARGGHMMSEALVVDGVHKSFGALEVLRGVDLAVAEHEVVCLIGASGSGKSTLLRCVNLLEPIDAGRIVVEGEEITARGVDVNKVRRRIGIVFQAYNLFPHMSVLANVTLAPTLALETPRARGRGARRPRCWTASGSPTSATTIRTDSRAASSSGSRSCGRWRCSPDLMLLDEVTSALDPELVAEVLEVIRELAAGGMTMLIATHEMSFARDIADRVCFLDEGVILEQGPPAQILSDPKEPRTQQFLQRIIEAGRL